MEYETILSQMQETYRSLTGFDADGASDIGIRLRVLAEQVAGLYRRLEELGRQAFPQTGTGEALDRHAACRGLRRKAARQAEGVLRFARELPAPYDIPIGAGVVCATRPEPQLQFETAAGGVLPAGETWVELPARAAEAGEEGNVAPGAVCLMVSAASGISSVTNPAPFTGGADEEGDDALRERLLAAYRTISNGTNGAYYYDLALQNEAVSSAAVLPRVRGRGTVDVVVRCPAGAEEAVAVLRETMERAREINVDVAVRAAREQTVNLVLRVAPAEGAGFEMVCGRCREAAEAYLNALGVGQPLLISRLTARLLELDGVYNAAVKTPAGDVIPDGDAVLVPGAVTVERLVGVT